MLIARNDCKINYYIYQPAAVAWSTGDVDDPCQNPRHWTPGTVATKSSPSELDMADYQSEHNLCQYLGPKWATLSLGGQIRHVIDDEILRRI